MQTCNLMLHCGAQTVERAQLADVALPAATRTWVPLAHADLLHQVRRTILANNLSVVTESHSLSHDGARYFGLLQVANGANGADYSWIVGLRNSHDKHFPAGLVVGMSVFVCDNLSFSGEIQLARKHTRFIKRDLPLLTETAIGRLVERWHDQDIRIGRYRDATVSDAQAHDLVVRAVDVGVCPISKVPEVLREWREPSHADFRPRNAWSLFNGFTEALKGNLGLLPKRTTALHGLIDAHVGLAGRN